MTNARHLAAAALGLALLAAPAPARADHTGAALAPFIGLVAGSSVAGLGGATTTVGTAVTYGEPDATGWRVASYVFGAHNALMGGLWFSFSDELAPAAYGVATAHLVLAGANVALAVASSVASADAPEEVTAMPTVTVAEDVAGRGVPVLGVVGRF